MTGAEKEIRLARAPSLAGRVLDPGFTPRAADVDRVLDLLADDTLAVAAERTAARVGSAAIPALLARLPCAVPPLRARLVRTLGRIAARGGVPEAVDVLLRTLGDPDPKARRNAAIALGHVREPRVEDALAGAWTDDPRPEMRRSLASSLGKIGTPASLALLREASHDEDAELARIAGRAVMMIERTASRPPPERRPRIDPSRAPPVAMAAVALCRSGLEEILAEELGAIPELSEVRVECAGRVAARLRGPMKALFGARTMIRFRFPLPPERIEQGEAVEDALARAVAGEPARRIFDAWGAAAPRYRIAWARGGHGRAATWRAARALGRAAPHLINDPTDSGWQIVAAIRSPFLDVEIEPRRLDDPRFAWRTRDVPAASHPTLAAALARLAEAERDDVVWDPFAGSGAELIERAMLGPFRSLVGSDTDERALAAARANLAAAGFEATLHVADASKLHPAGVTLVLTNPPMGRRSARAHGLTEFLDRFLVHAASVLRPGGRLVWIAPWPRRARTAAAGAGLVLRWARCVDMGGFEAEMQRWERRP